MIHSVRSVIVRHPKRRWAHIVDLVSADGDRDEIARFAHIDEAYGFCSWLNGGERPAFRTTTLGQMDNPPLPPEEDDE